MTATPIPQAEKRLLAFLVRTGRAVVENRDALIAEAAERKVSILELLDDANQLSSAEAASALAKELRLPLIDLDTLQPDEAALEYLTEDGARRLRMLPIRQDGKALVVAMANPFDQESLQDIRFKTGLRIQPAVAPLNALRDAIPRFYRLRGSLGTLLRDIPAAGQEMAITAPESNDRSRESLEKGAGDAPIIKMVNLILLEAMQRGASDIHVEPGPNLVNVRYRVNGSLEEALELPRWVRDPIVARVKIMSRLDITERRIPQDGRFGVRYRDRMLDFRVSTLPSSEGEKVVLRILDPTQEIKTLDGVGVRGRELTILRKAVTRPEGMILVTGPTGSGKTTTLYAMIREILNPEKNIVTIENPVEYEIPGVTQVDVNPAQGLTFAKSLRSILRQDPDIILVGEIRDAETAEVAFQASQTGHLVLSTLHTQDSIATVMRLLDLGIDPPLISSSVMAIVAQRLIRTVCPQCAEPVAPDDPSLAILGLAHDPAFRHGRGCSACRSTGASGRSGVFEVLEITSGFRRLLEARAPETKLAERAAADGMRTLVQVALDQVRAGRMSPAEVESGIQVRPTNATCPECAGVVDDSWTACPWCKATLRKLCATCAAPLQPEWQRCPFCGAEPSVPEPQPATEVGASGPRRTEPEAPPTGDISVVRVLIVDDNADLRRIVRLSLRGLPFDTEIVEAANGLEALERAAEHPPHIVLLDIMMPDLDGFEVCRRLRADLKTALIPVLMLTAREDSDSKTEGFLAGTDDYVVKPFEKEELVARVVRLVTRTYGAIAAPAQGEKRRAASAGAV